LQRIYVALEDFDSLSGVSATRKKKPSPYEEILQKLAIGNKEVGQRLHIKELVTVLPKIAILLQ
jgi:hypothetical protein